MDASALLDAIMAAKAELQAARCAFWSYAGQREGTPLDPDAAQALHDEKVRRLLADAYPDDE